MNTFGTIKTNIENTAIELAKKPSFKRFIFEFNGMVLKNKDISELYYIYDDLSTVKSLDKDLANDYINESIEYSQILIESQSKNINYLNIWINSWNKSNKNNYSDIDNAIYNKGIRNLESVLESKNNIKKTLISENKKLAISEQKTNLPISSMVKIANETLKKEINLNESEKKELNEILSLNGNKLKEEFERVKSIVLSNLKNSLNESKDSDLNNTIDKTIQKIEHTKCDHYEYYKLKKLSLGL
jgi:membrane-associated HD superfamily phosphohydrolase